MGRRALSRDADETAATVANLSPSERQMFQVGLAQDLLDRIDRTPDNVDATRRIFGNDLVRSRVAAAFGGENTPEFQNFRQIAESEAQFAATNRQFLQGSPTARRAAAIAEAQGGAPANALLAPLLHVATGGSPAGAMIGLAHAAANPLLSRVAAPSERYNQALGNMLFNPATRDQTLNMLAQPSAPPVRNMLMGWPGQQAAVQLTLPRRAQGAAP